MIRYSYTVFAQAYGEGDYGGCDYNDNCTTTAGTGTSGNTPSGGNPLADTGVAVLAVITLACLIIFVALVVRLVGRRRAAAVSVTTDEEAGIAAPGADRPA